MANPTPFTPSYSFSDFAEENPSTPLPGVQVDIQYDAIELTTDQIIAALADIRRSDGALVNGIVTPDSLSAGLVMGFTVEGVWTNGTIYQAADGVTYGTSFYKARVAHTAAPATRPDLSPATWTFLFTFDSIAVGDAAVTTVKLADGAVTAVKLASDSVTTVKILDANVTAAKLAADAVTTVKILDANVTAAKLASDSVTTIKIVDANVTAAKLASDAVTTVKILDAAVTLAKLAAAAITSLYAGARSNMLALANTWTGVQTISTAALDLAVGQIKFPATVNPSSDANTLDDYEEGTWTPTISASGATFSVLSAVATYTKVGNICVAEWRWELNGSGNTFTANAASLSGLPFPAASTPSGRNYPCWWGNSSSSYLDVWFSLNGSASSGGFYGNTAAATNFGTALLANALFANSGRIGSVVTYRTS